MKKIFLQISLLVVILVGAVTPAFAAGADDGKYSPEMQAVIDQVQKYNDEKEQVAKNLATFDELDYMVFSNQEWVRLHESHSPDVIVNWPDGHKTYGIDKHIEDLKAMFVYAPDTQIKVHPIRIGQGEFTAVTGIMTGTFSKPMPLGDGKFIQPTGKKYSIPMCTVGHWKDGVMIEEFLYWDNATFMKQIGL
ncbi:MAG: ester cyclase [Negativicutes bacterium]|nr:ester cyclase [Negativicutes bacterium]